MSAAWAARARLAGGLVAVVGLLGHRLGDDGVERGRAVGAGLGDERGRLGDVRVHLRHVGGLVVREALGQRLVEDAAERVDVGAGVHRLAADLLGGGVVDAAHEQAGLGQGVLGGVLGEAEVGEVDVLLGADQDVGGLDVAVDQARARARRRARPRPGR